jgi:hypothetical protein
MKGPVLAFTNKKAAPVPAASPRLLTKLQRLESLSWSHAQVVEKLVDDLLKGLEVKP